MSSVSGDHHEQPAGHPAGAVDEDISSVRGPDPRDDAGRGEEWDRQQRRLVPAQGGWLCRDVRLGREEPLRPGALVAKWRAVDEHLVAFGKPAHARPDRPDDTGRLDAECHRWPGAHIPGAGPDQIVPVADARPSDLDEDIAAARFRRFGEFEQLDRSTEGSDPGGAHAVSIAATTADHLVGRSPTDRYGLPGIARRHTFAFGVASAEPHGAIRWQFET